MLKKVIDLKTITKYKDRGSLLDAILDDDFKTRYSALLASVIRIKNPQKREKGFEIIQRKIDPASLEKIGWALDYYGYMYEYREDPMVRVKCKERTYLKDKAQNELPKYKKKFAYACVIFISNTHCY